MTNIEKALEAHPTPWSRTKGEETGWNYIVDGNGETFLIDDVGDEEIDLIIAAVNAYEPKKPCEACRGTGGYSGDTLIGYKHPPLPEVLGARPARVKCSICNGTGKQPDPPDVDSEAIHLLGLEIVKRDKVIRELKAACEESLEFIRGFHKTILRSTPMSATEVLSRHLKPKLKAALANAKKVAE